MVKSLPPSSSSSPFITPLSVLLAVSTLLNIILMVASSEGGGQIKLPPNVTFPAVIGFGDSIIDPGNNNNIKTVVKCNFSPYGKDFVESRPTGRFSNDKIPTDFVVEQLGIKSYLPAYLDPGLKPEELLTGVSFASGASGYDPLTPTIVSVIPLAEQVRMFKEYTSRLKGMVGEEKTNSIIRNSIFVVVAGSDDIANTYFDTPFRRKTYDFEAYTNLMLGAASSFIQQLYGLGARRIAVFGAPPIGCVPSQRTLGGGPVRVCAHDYNRVARLFNAKLSSKMASLKPQLPDSRLVFVDIYTPLLDIIMHPTKYGFEVVDEGCCGTGLLEVAILCNKLDAVCADASKYLFWDSYHPTHKGYHILTQIVLAKYLPSLI